MKTTLNRRQWFSSAFATSSALILTPSLVHQLMAAPMGKAEASYSFLGSTSKTKIRLNANENPYGPSEKAKQAVMQILSEGNRYPFAALDSLKELLAKKEGVSVDHIHIGAGSGSLLCQTGLAFGIEGGSILSGFPTFPILMNYATVFNSRWDKVNLNDKLEYDCDAISSSIKPDTKLVVICNPNNPTGTLVDPIKVRAFAKDVSDRVTVFSDEAYLEFLSPEQHSQVSLIDLVRKNANVIVCRTFSKIYGLAGLRLGYLVARPDLIQKVKKYGSDIPMSQTGIAAAIASMGDEPFMKLVRDKNAEARSVLTDYLDSKKIFYGKSLTNFVFFPAPADGKTILKKMDEKGYLIRIWDYQQKEWCRVSIGTLDEMKGFVNAFREIA
jgi:histidinol-phosphate aminotransferase